MGVQSSDEKVDRIVVLRGEIGPDETFLKWDEPTWEGKRRELAASPVPWPDWPFPGYVASDRLYWLRKEYEQSNSNEDGLRLVEQLMVRAERFGDHVEAAYWHGRKNKLFPEVAPPPREVRK
jgi:hypothetical protein